MEIGQGAPSFSENIFSIAVRVPVKQASGRIRGGGGGWVYSIFMHGRSRMTIHPRTPATPGRSTSGFHQPGRHCLHQARSAGRCSASRMKGELHPSKNRAQDGRRHLVPTSLLADNSANEIHFVSQFVGGGRGGGQTLES